MTNSTDSINFILNYNELNKKNINSHGSIKNLNKKMDPI